MFSAIDSEKRNVSCGTMPIHSRSWRSGIVSIGRPSRKIVPGGGSNARVISESSVDLPLPVRPTMPTVWPWRTSRLMSRSTGRVS